jgi:hypothetical protein
MAYRTSAGVAFYVSQTFAATKTVTAVTNANPAEATSTAHGYANGNELLFVSGWERASNTVFRAADVSTNALDLSGLNSTNTNLYASGAGTGTLSLISNWIEIPQVLGISTSGGDAKNITVNPLKLVQGILLPNGFNPATITLSIGSDESLANWSTLLDISRSNTLVAFKAVKGSGAASYGYGYFQMAEVDQQGSEQVDTVDAQFLSQGRIIKYA